jgi:beta-galactosidase
LSHAPGGGKLLLIGFFRASGPENRMIDGTFFHGTSYYHFANPASQWPENFRKIRDMGLDTVRVAEIWPGWETLEPRPGAFDFAALDDYVDQAVEAGLNVVMGVGINNPPMWVFEDHPDVRLVSTQGHPAGRRIQSANHDDPRLRQWMERFIDTHARHYADKPLLAWQMGNEVRYGVDIPDNPMSHQRFRLWLSEAWDNDLDALNRTWGTFYRDWSEIYPYASSYGAPTEGLTPLALATRKYKAWSLAELVEWGIAILRRHSALPVFHNNHDISGSTYSHWEMGALGDIVCQDLYPTGSQDPQGANTLGLDLGSSVSRTLGKDLWIGETAVGQYGTYLRDRPDRKQIEALVVEMLGAGARSLFYFRHKSPRFEQPHKFTGAQGALRVDGSESPYAKTPRNVRALLEKIGATLTASRPVAPRLGAYWPEESLLLSQDAGYRELQRDVLFGTAGLMNRLGYPLQWFDSEWICAEDLSAYDVLYVPSSFLIPRAVGEAIARYVRDGGNLICEGRCAYVDDHGWLYDVQPGAGLHEVLGLREDLYWQPEQLGVMMAIGSRTHRCKARRLAQTLRPDGADVTGRSDDGEPIATSHAFHAGRAVCLGFSPSLLLAPGGVGGQDPSAEGIEIVDRQEMLDLVDDLLWQLGLRRPVEIEFDSRFLSFRYLSCRQGVLAFVCNHGPRTTIALPEGGLFVACSSDGQVVFPDDPKPRQLDRFDWCIARCPAGEDSD